MRILFGIIGLSFLSACGTDNATSSNALSRFKTEQDCVGKSIEEKLEKCIAGVKILEVKDLGPKGKDIKLTFEQPIDHFDPTSGTFSQLLHLNTRGEDRPMVLVTTGYSLYSTSRKEPSVLLDANQLTVEHRYFGQSVPAVMDWSKLNVKQSAYDFHRITVEFKKVFKKNWVNTGASKGGMTSVYHRYFFPDDLAGTVAYVAPHSFSDQDPRYNEFLDNVGGSAYATCRSNLKKFQREIVQRQDKLVPFVKGTFTRFKGGKAGAIEVAASEVRFVFWQYGNPSDCALFANLNLNDQAFYNLFNKISQFEDSYDDDTIAFFQSYYFQAATELGGPAIDRAGINDIIKFPENFSFAPYMPSDAGAINYDNKTMLEVDAWVKQFSSRILYIYGEFDTWTAAKFDLGSSVDRDSHIMLAPKGNHGSSIALLSSADNRLATSVLKKWVFGTKEDESTSSFVKDTSETAEEDSLRLGMRP